MKRIQLIIMILTTTLFLSGCSDHNYHVQNVGIIGNSSGAVIFDEDGSITLNGSARVIKHIHLPVYALKQDGNPPTETVTGLFPVLEYSSSINEVSYGVLHIPEDWDTTTNMTVHIHWSPNDNTVGNVSWFIQYKSVASNNGETIIGVQRTLSFIDSSEGLQDEMLKSVNMIIPATDLEDLDMLGISITRNATNPEDNYAGVASLELLEVLYISNKLGEQI